MKKRVLIAFLSIFLFILIGFIIAENISNVSDNSSAVVSSENNSIAQDNSIVNNTEQINQTVDENNSDKIPMLYSDNSTDISNNTEETMINQTNQTSDTTNMTIIKNNSTNEYTNFTNKITKILWSVKCQLNKINLRLKITKYNKDKLKFEKKFSKDISNIKKTIAKYNKKNTNTTILNDDLIIFVERVNLTKSDYSDLIDMYSNASQSSCDISQKKYNRLIKDAKAELNIVNEDVKNANIFYKKVSADEKG